MGESIEQAIADAVARTVRDSSRAAQARVDVSSITTPTALLRFMVYELGTQAGHAITAGQGILGDAAGASDPFWQRIQLLTSHSASVASFIWPGDQRRKRLKQAFPQRGRDIQHLLGLTDPATMSAVRGVRDSMAHIDERLEEHWLDHSDAQPLTVRSTTGPTMTGPGQFLSWDSSAAQLTFIGHTVQVGELMSELMTIQARSLEAFSLLLHCEDD